MREKLLSMIEKNSRMDIKELSVILGVEEETIEKELLSMEEEGVICGYHTMIDWDKVDPDKVMALIEVKVTPQRGRGFEQIAERIYQYPEVTSTYLMSGGFDLMVIIEGRTLKEVSTFVTEKLATIEEVSGTATHFILKKYKDHGIVMAEAHTDERQKVMA